MPLLDHFRAPLHPRRHGESFLVAWANAIADLLSDKAPADHFAEVVTQSGTPAVTAQIWTPAAPLVMPAVFPPTFEVRVFAQEAGAKLVGAIELVSPGNKDRPETRRAFIAKCASYLAQGIGLIVLDVVTTRQANLHNELIAFMQTGDQFAMTTDSSLYAVAYRPLKSETEHIDIWPVPLALGGRLPVLPLSLGASLCLPIDFDATYAAVCRRRRIA